MAQIKAGVADATNYFNLNGLDYQKGDLWEVYYNSKVIKPDGTVDKDKVEVGIRSSEKPDKVLQSPQRFSNWKDGVGTPYVSLEALLVDLASLVGFNSPEVAGQSENLILNVGQSITVNGSDQIRLPSTNGGYNVESTLSTNGWGGDFNTDISISNSRIINMFPKIVRDTSILKLVGSLFTSSTPLVTTQYAVIVKVITTPNSSGSANLQALGNQSIINPQANFRYDLDFEVTGLTLLKGERVGVIFYSSGSSSYGAVEFQAKLYGS